MNAEEELEGFCKRWLAAWTGNDPAGLLDFYAGDAFYSCLLYTSPSPRD